MFEEIWQTNKMLLFALEHTNFKKKQNKKKHRPRGRTPTWDDPYINHDIAADRKTRWATELQAATSFMTDI